MFFLLMISFFCFVHSDGYTCIQYRHTKDESAFAQTCSVYGLVKSMPYWNIVGTWSIYTDCRGCGSPFHNFTQLGDLKVVRGPLYADGSYYETEEKQKDFYKRENKNNSDPTTLNPCCIFGEAPYYDSDFLAEAINPNTGETCKYTKYQFKLMGQWKTSHFYSPLSWCFWQTYNVRP